MIIDVRNVIQSLQHVKYVVQEQIDRIIPLYVLVNLGFMIIMELLMIVLLALKIVYPVKIVFHVINVKTVIF